MTPTVLHTNSHRAFPYENVVNITMIKIRFRHGKNKMQICKYSPWLFGTLKENFCHGNYQFTMVNTKIPFHHGKRQFTMVKWWDIFSSETHPGFSPRTLDSAKSTWSVAVAFYSCPRYFELALSAML
jgi:hypothetical protein